MTLRGSIVLEPLRCAVGRARRSRSSGMGRGGRDAAGEELKGAAKTTTAAIATNTEMLAITSAIVAIVFALRAARATTHAASLASAAIRICSLSMSGWLHAHFHPATRKLASVSRHYKGQRGFGLAHRLARVAHTQFCLRPLSW